MKGKPSKENEKRLNFHLATPFKQVSALQDNMYYEMRELFSSIPINTRKTVKEVKYELIQVIDSDSSNEFNGKLKPELVRFRQKSSETMTKVFEDDEIFDKYGMHDNKDIAVQILQEPE